MGLHTLTMSETELTLKLVSSTEEVLFKEGNKNERLCSYAPLKISPLDL